MLSEARAIRFMEAVGKAMTLGHDPTANRLVVSFDAEGVRLRLGGHEWIAGDMEACLGAAEAWLQDIVRTNVLNARFHLDERIERQREVEIVLGRAL